MPQPSIIAAPATPASAETVLHARLAFIAGVLRPADIHIAAGRITAISPLTDAADALPGVLLPGLVDTHVHVNEPGRTDWEGFGPATRAAAAGGVTTILDMPLNSIPVTTTPEALGIKRRAAAGQVEVDTGFWGGAVPQNLGRLGELWDQGVFGFKSFTSPSGIPEFDPLSPELMERAMREIAELDALLIVHSEDPHQLAPAGPLGREYRSFLSSRPDSSEATAVANVLELAHRTGARVHILHVSSAASLPLIRAAKAAGDRVTAETCPHYLTIDIDRIPDGATEFKCCPPVRDRAAQLALWEGLLDGTLDAVVSDHSPATVELKTGRGGDWGLAWGGISSLQLGLAAMWTKGRQLGVGLESIVPWMSAQPADLVGLDPRGRIAAGAPADFALFDPDAPWTVDPAALQSRNPVSAFAGMTLAGRVTRVWRHGEPLLDQDGSLTEPAGDLLSRLD